MLKELEDINKQISNIVNAIMQGFNHEEFKEKMDKLKGRKTEIEVLLTTQEARSKDTKVTEEQVRTLFGMFRGVVRDRNIPECKKFIQSYVDKVIVYKDHVEVIFHVVFTILQDYESYKIKSSVKKATLFKRYRYIWGES